MTRNLVGLGLVGVSMAVLLLAACGQASEKPTATPTPTADPGVSAIPTGTPVAPPALADPLTLGSKDAKDDLYCSGVILAGHPGSIDSATPQDAAVLMQASDRAGVLSIRGAGRVVDEGHAKANNMGQLMDAWLEAAMADAKAKKTKISLKDCEDRADKAMADLPK